ncbi:MAG: exodeoxyribonuclease VII large subunit [Pseudomonadota bacterium]
MTDPAHPSPPPILRVSELNREVRVLLERGFPLVWIQGEISNFTRPASGHIYFSLKDELAQVRCAMFKPKSQYLAFKPENGMAVLARARISLYEPRGEFQIIVEHLALAGAGALRRQFEELKTRLAALGLFDTARKRPLPSLPRCVGVVTSPTGAAIHDILTVLRRRFPAIPVWLYPTAVQGVGAAAEIAQAIRLASQRRDCDVLIVGRGGGSLEDLWSFNDAAVAHAIAECSIPVVSAVGHEVDVTIADFVADVRAPTPSAAAELVVPDSGIWLSALARSQTRLDTAIQRTLAAKKQRLEWISQRIQHPRRRLQGLAQRTDETALRLQRAMVHFLRSKQQVQQQTYVRLQRQAPSMIIQKYIHHSVQLLQRLEGAQQRRMGDARQRWIAAASALDAVSPLATLARGYAIVRNTQDGKLVRNAVGIQVGDRIEIQLQQGRVLSRVEETRDE